jgi:hypothetical protein
MDALALLPHLVNSSHREIPCALQGKSLGIRKAQVHDACLGKLTQQTTR